MELIAQLNNVSDAHIRESLIFGSFLLSMAVNVVLMVRQGKPQKAQIEPQPLEVKATEKLVTIEHCKIMNRSIAERLEKVEAEQREQRRMLDGQIGDLHEKINGVGREVSELNGSVTSMGHQLTNLISQVQSFMMRK